MHQAGDVASKPGTKAVAIHLAFFVSLPLKPSLAGGCELKDIKGLLIQGNADIVSDPAETLALTRESAKQRGAPEADLPTEPRPGVAYIRITPKKYISWDYSRES